jgi:hypothetical protein
MRQEALYPPPPSRRCTLDTLFNLLSPALFMRPPCAARDLFLADGYLCWCKLTMVSLFGCLQSRFLSWCPVEQRCAIGGGEGKVSWGASNGNQRGCARPPKLAHG